MTTVQAPAKTGYEKWQDGIDEAPSDDDWSRWDTEIQRAVTEYNRHLAGTAGYVPLDWQLIKAMLWVETGADDPQWNSRPMQIGVTGDPGMTSFLSDKEGGELILPPAWKGRLTTGSARSTPAHNIQAGIGYLLMRMAHFEFKSVLAADTKVYEVTARPGDSLDRIAKAQGTTVEVLRKLNSTGDLVRPGQVVKYQKASVQRVISSWRPISNTLIAQRYNGGRDPNYAKKLDYALPLVGKAKAAGGMP